MTAAWRATLTAAPDAAATPLRQGYARTLARSPERGRTIHEPASAPFDLDGGLRAAMDLQPTE